MSGVDRLPCSECRATWTRYGKNPPCENCYPGVHEFNHNLYRLYGLVGDQFLMGPSGPVALSLPAIITGLEILDINRNDYEMAVNRIKSFVSLIFGLRQK